VTDRETVAREALHEITRDADVGALVSETVADDGVATLQFAATMLGYPGWHWTVSVAQVDGDEPTVLEAELLPGDGALLAPDWVPWSERLEEWTAQQAAEAASGADESDDDDDSDEDDDDSDEDEDSDEDDDESDDDDDDSEDEDDDFGDDEHDDLGDDVYDGLDPESAHASHDEHDEGGSLREY
jgi:hypothetical protein